MLLFNNPQLAAQRYLFCSEEEARIVSEKNTTRDFLKSQITDLGEPDENGNIIWYFDNPIISTNSNDIYIGLMLQRRVSEYTDEDVVLEIIDKYGLRDRCVHQEVLDVVDLDAVYACNQEGVISDDEIDSMIVVKETFALTKVKG